MNVVVTIIKALPVSSVVPLITVMSAFFYDVLPHGVAIVVFIHLFDDYAVAWMVVVMSFMVPRFPIMLVVVFVKVFAILFVMGTMVIFFIMVILVAV